MDKLVAIILVNYNGYRDTVNCVHSILLSEYKNYKIIVVDNASTNNEELKKDKFLNENTDLLFLDKNIGFSGGNNRGIEYAQKLYDPAYYLLLNNDTEIQDKALGELVETFERTENCGLATGKIFHYNIYIHLKTLILRCFSLSIF